MIDTLIYTTFCVLLLLVEAESQRPGGRFAHTATFIGNKLYILGGESYNKTQPNETFFYLDLSAPFNTSSLSWTLLSSNDTTPSRIYAAAVRGGANNNTLFLYGGDSLSGQSTNLVYIFDTQSNIWSVPEITGTPPAGKVSITPTIDINGRIYLYGGATTYYNGTYVNDTIILDSIGLIWRKASSINAPSPRIDYGAVLLPDKNIIYMGGYNAMTVGVLTLDEVYLYNTTNDVWITKTTSGTIPSARSAFSSVLGLDGQRVILFGGFGNNEETLSPTNSLFGLNLNDFSWYTPKISGEIPLNRAHHRTIVFEKYMVITFGLGYTQEIENDILLLDISNNDEYIWTTSFEPLSSASPSLVPSSTAVAKPGVQPTIKIIVAVGTVLIGISTIIIGIIIFYKRYKRRNREKIIVIPPGSDSTEYSQERTFYGQEIAPLHSKKYNQSLYNHLYNNGQAVTNIQETNSSVLNNEIQTLDDAMLRDIREAIKEELRREIIQDLRAQETNSPVLNNNQNSLQNSKNENLQALRKEIMQDNLSQSSQYNDQVDNFNTDYRISQRQIDMSSKSK